MSIAQPISERKASPLIISAKAIVPVGNDILLLRQPDGSWDLPGGKVKRGEKVKVGLKREVWEETGLDVTPTDLLGTSLSSLRKRRDKLVLSFLCQPLLDDDKIKISDEHIGFAKVPLQRALWLDLKPHHRSAVLAATQKHMSQLKQAAQHPAALLPTDSRIAAAS